MFHRGEVMKKAFFCGAVLLLATNSVFSAGLNAVGVTAGIPETSDIVMGETFFTATSQMRYDAGTVILSSDLDGMMSTTVDDVISITVKHADGSVKKYTHDYSHGCTTGIVPMKAKDITPLFAVGLNQVKVVFKDTCGGGVMSSPVWISTH
jgi:hypothetical protein